MSCLRAGRILLSCFGDVPGKCGCRKRVSKCKSFSAVRGAARLWRLALFLCGERARYCGGIVEHFASELVHKRAQCILDCKGF